MKNITLGVGVENIKFGMTKGEIEELLGAPNDKELYSYDEESEDADLTEVWHYDSLEFSLSFDEADDWRLVMIAASDENYTINGKTIIGLPEEEIEGALKSLGFTSIEVEELEEDEDEGKVYKVEDKSLNIWIDLGVASEIQFGPFWDENEEPIWP